MFSYKSVFCTAYAAILVIYERLLTYYFKTIVSQHFSHTLFIYISRPFPPFHQFDFIFDI